jgi:hypothetical protein
MKDTFEANLESSRKNEAAAKQAFAELKTAKTQEIEAGQAQVDSKKQTLADTQEKLATDRQDLENTKNSRAADDE